MKRVLAILLIFSLSAHCLYRLGMFTYFQVEYDYVVNQLCINRDKPITLCSGKCFLDKHVFAGNSSEEQLPLAKAEKIELIYFLIQPKLVLSKGMTNRKRTDFFYPLPIHSYLFSMNVFQPPEA